MEQHKKASQKVNGDLKAAKAKFKAEKNAKAKSTLTASIKKLENEIKALGNSFNLLKGKEQYLKDVAKSAKAAVKPKASANDKTATAAFKPAAKKTSSKKKSNISSTKKTTKKSKAA
jgi:hypothetical protein